MQRNRLDGDTARRKTGSLASRRELFGNVATPFSPGPPARTPLDELAVAATAPITRRRGLRWALNGALVLMAVPTLDVASALANDNPLNLSDRAIIELTDHLLEVELAGQEVPIFGLLESALIFYEAAEVLDSGPPDAPPPTPSDCEPGSFYCGCFGGFCLIDGADCGSYC